MNKLRRKAINDNMKLLENIKSNLKDILSEEEMCFDNIPENLQGSLKGEESESVIEILNETVDAIEECITELNSIV